jgi:hypothetical protein
MINWTKLTVADLEYIINCSINIGFFHLAKSLIKDLEKHKQLENPLKYVKISK